MQEYPANSTQQNNDPVWSQPTALHISEPQTATPQPIQEASNAEPHNVSDYQPKNSNNITNTNYKCRNANFAIFFYITVTVNTILAMMYFMKSKNKDVFSLKWDTNDPRLQEALTPDYTAISIGIITAIVYTFGWLFLVSWAPTRMIKTSLIAFPVILIVGGIINFIYTGSVLALMVLVISGLFGLAYAYAVKNRIKFASICLEIATTVFKEFKTPIFINILMAILSIILLGTDILAYFGLETLIGKNIDKIFWVLILFQIWHLYTFSNIGHTTACGVMATWWYTRQINGVTIGSFTRAITTSFGSIAFGSFLEGLFTVLRIMLDKLQNDSWENGNYLMCCLACIGQCIVSCLGDILEYVNTYAYVHVGVYGKDYITAAKDTLNMFKSRAMMALINDDLTSLPFNVGGIMGVIIFIIPVVLINKASIISIVIVAVFGIFWYAIIVSIIISYVKTMFVCWVEDPLTLKQNRPQKFNTLVAGANSCGYNVAWSQI